MDRYKARQLLELSDNFYMEATRKIAELGVWDDGDIEKALTVIAEEYAIENGSTLDMLGLRTEDLLKAFRNYQ